LRNWLKYAPVIITLGNPNTPWSRHTPIPSYL
jgi:hypothetical protein